MNPLVFLFLVFLLFLCAVILFVGAKHGFDGRAGTGKKTPDLSIRAFALWEQAGHPTGREWEFWDQAVSERPAEPE